MFGHVIFSVLLPRWGSVDLVEAPPPPPRVLGLSGTESELSRVSRGNDKRRLFLIPILS